MLEKTDIFTLQDIWNNVMSILSEKLTTTSIKTWFSDCTPVDLDNDLLVLHTPSELKRSVLNQRFESEIKDALQEMFSCDFNLLILAGDTRLFFICSFGTVADQATWHAYRLGFRNARSVGGWHKGTHID